MLPLQTTPDRKRKSAVCGCRGDDAGVPVHRDGLGAGCGVREKVVDFAGSLENVDPSVGGKGGDAA